MADPDTLILYQPPGRPFGAPNLSPFCMKLECYLRMAGVPHEVRAADMRKAPKGKIPYVALGGELVGDSQIIIDRLERSRGAPLDAWLDADQRALGHVVRRMLEEAYYYIGVYLRWVDDDGFRVLAPEIRKVLPGPLKLLLPLIRRKVRATLRAQGTGRHSHDEIMAMGKRDLDALATLLGDRAYLLGDRPSTYDATLYGFLEALFCFPYESAVQRHGRGLANLVAYRERLRAQYFPQPQGTP